MIIYGVFTDNKLIFGEDRSYAVYEKRNFAQSKADAMHGYFSRTEYDVRKIEVDCDIASGTFVEEKEEKTNE